MTVSLSAPIYRDIHSALQGNRQFKIVFKESAAFHANYLMAMINDGLITVDSSSLGRLEMAARRGYWSSVNGDSRADRTFTVKLTHKMTVPAHQQRFAMRVNNAAETFCSESTPQ